MSLICTSDLLKASKSTFASYKDKPNLKTQVFANRYRNSLGICSATWNILGRSNLAIENFRNICGRMLKKPVKTRSLKVSLKFDRMKINEFQILHGISKKEASHLTFIEEYVQILEPIAICLDRMQDEKKLLWVTSFPI